MSVLDLTAVQQRKSLEAISEIKIEPGQGGSLKISLRVLGGRFAPLSLHNCSAKLVAELAQGTIMKVNGKLEFTPTNEAHGTWFAFVFESEVTNRRTALFPRIQFSGLQNMWSNIRVLQLRAGNVERRFTNPFFRPRLHPPSHESH